MCTLELLKFCIEIGHALSVSENPHSKRDKMNGFNVQTNKYAIRYDYSSSVPRCSLPLKQCRTIVRLGPAANTLRIAWRWAWVACQRASSIQLTHWQKAQITTASQFGCGEEVNRTQAALILSAESSSTWPRPTDGGKSEKRESGAVDIVYINKQRNWHLTLTLPD